jgi:hypothetical protein
VDSRAHPGDRECNVQQEQQEELLVPKPNLNERKKRNKRKKSRHMKKNKSTLYDK